MQTVTEAPKGTPPDARKASAPVPLPVPTRVVLTVKQLAEQQPGLTEGGIRWDLFNRDKNGLVAAGAILRRGRKILIDPARYLDWLNENRERAA
ncbi:hypothetical protein [uncultured Thiodictyon sp.]|uniref:hypothetical protein n=1 Tax=uncultured Thiodictyon sp. TaxID=1846217 RepID=UPI0025EA559A|nr:hypothetical protein [uncultured Thiodictyon sp.]